MVVGVTIDRTGAGFAIEGSIVSLDILGFVQGSADFVITKRFVDARNVGGPDLAGATLLTIALSDLDLSVGDPAGVHVDVTGGSLLLAALKPAAATGAATDTREWLALKGGLTGLDFIGVDGLEINLSTLGLEINTASGAYDVDGAGTSSTPENAVALDWTGDLDLDQDTTFGETAEDDVTGPGGPIDFTGAFVRASGTASINIFDFVSGSVSFTFEQQLADIDADDDGDLVPSDVISEGTIRGPPDLDNATITTLGLEILAPGLHVGVPGGIGFTIPSGSLALAVVTPAAGSTGDTRSWLALKGSIAGGVFDGIDGLAISATNLTIEINRASGTYNGPGAPLSGPVAAQALDWANAIDLDESAVSFDPDDVVVEVETLTGTTSHTFAYPGELLRLTGDLAADIFGFVGVVAHFELTTYETSGTGGGVVLTDAAVLEFSLTPIGAAATAEVFVGVGAVVDLGLGTIDRSNAVGFSAGVASLMLVLVSDDTRSFTGLSIEGLSAELDGIDGFVAAATGVDVQVNVAKDTSLPAGTAAPLLDWAGFSPGQARPTYRS